MSDPIPEACSYNQNDLSRFKGHRVYYNKYRNGSILGLSACLCTFLLFLNYAYWKPVSGVGWTILLIGCIVYQVLTIGQRLLFRKPVMILSKGKLYYAHTNKWYDVRHYQFEDMAIDRHNYFGTFCMIKKGQNIIAERNWHLDGYQYKVLDLIRYIKLVESKEGAQQDRT
jgi:hypothetical protein